MHETPAKPSRRRFNARERLALDIVSGGQCEQCGEKLGDSFHADHVVPFSRGGPTDLSNAQALCPRCNLSKGNRMRSPRRLRAWQRDCLHRLINVRIEQRRDAMLTACPASGKTTAALTFAAEGMRNGEYDFVIVLVPQSSLKHQWKEDAAGHGLKLRSNFNNLAIRKGQRGGGTGLADDIHGLCVTYSQVATDPETMRAICARSRVLVIMDEVHHASDDQKWGKALVHAFSGAEFRLLLSGTPFRTDGAPIPFVRYDADGYCTSDYTYSYGQALADGVVRPMVFPRYDGPMEWMAGDDVYTARFSDELDRADEGRRLVTAIQADGLLARNMLGRANETLIDIRTNGKHKDAGGLVVARNRIHADQIAAVLRRDLKVDPVVVYYDHEEKVGGAEERLATDKIKKFRKSADPWIIAINMISEGVDISRLRVVVWLTNKVTDLFFAQVWARAARMVDGLDLQTAYCYLPADRRLVEMALRVKDEIRHALVPEDPGREPPDDHDGPTTPRPPSGFLPISADGDEDGHITGGVVVPFDEVERMRAVQQRIPSLRAAPAADLCILLRECGMAFPRNDLAPGPAPLPVADADDEYRFLGAKVNGAVNLLVADLKPMAGEAMKARLWGKVHKWANDHLGISSQTAATAAQLRKKLAMVEAARTDGSGIQILQR